MLLVLLMILLIIRVLPLSGGGRRAGRGARGAGFSMHSRGMYATSAHQVEQRAPVGLTRRARASKEPDAVTTWGAEASVAKASVARVAQAQVRVQRVCRKSPPHPPPPSLNELPFTSGTHGTQAVSVRTHVRHCCGMGRLSTRAAAEVDYLEEAKVGA